MLFYEPLFLFIFFPAVFAAFLTVRRHAALRGWLLLSTSVFFYLWRQPLFVPVVLASCIADYALGLVIARGDMWRRPALTAGILINLFMLFTYKYANFAIANFGVLFAKIGIPLWHFPAILLPIGVSFIVFEKITYLVDIARDRSRPAPNFHAYLLYVFLFPKLLAGPIIKYHELEAQIRAAGHSCIDDMVTGFRRFMLGVVKKTILADTLGAGADMAFNANPLQLGCADAWWGVLFFAFQIYLDFSAYSDMAIGLARIFGFRLNENFNKPYISGSITEFWRRWHISLTSWIREYLYIPLGGNRVPVLRQYFNLWLCFLASGLWHGAAWHYVIWGIYNGVFLMLDRLFLLGLLAKLPGFAATFITFLITLVGWTFFRATTLSQAGLFFRAMVHPSRASQSPDIWRTPLMLSALAAALLISFLPRLPFYEKMAGSITAAPAGRWLLNSLLTLLFVIALAKALADPFKPFLYFRF